MAHRHPHSALIEAIPTTEVRKAFNLSAAHLHMWRVRGVPANKRPDFARLAFAHGLTLPQDFFVEMGFRPDDQIELAA